MGWFFEAPRWLDALWALPLVVIFYLFRKRARRLLVPFLPFWERVFAERRRRPSFVRTLVSILLQILAGAAILVALARPYREESRPVPIATVVIVDRSLGTRMVDGGVASSERTLARARAVADRAAKEGPIALAWLRDGLEPAGRAAEQQGVDALFSAPPAPSGARSLDAIAGLVRASAAATRVVFVTPFATDAAHVAGATILGTATGPLANGGIRAVALSQDGAELVVVVDGGPSQGALELVAADGAAVATVAIPAGPRAEVRLKIPPAAPEDAMLRVDARDAFADDDVAMLVLPERGRLRVLLASDVPTPALDAALLASSVMDPAGSGRVPLKSLGEVAGGFDVAILVGAPSGTALPPGRYVLVNSFAGDVPVARKGGVGEARAVSKAAVPWLAALDPEEWRVHRMESLEALPGFEVLVLGSRGPLVGRFERGGVQGIALTIAADLTASTLPLLPAFPLMLRGALRELAPRAAASGPIVHRAGARIVLSVTEAATLTRDDGAPSPLRLSPDGGGYVLPVEAGRFSAGGTRFSTAWLDHPGLPGATRTTDDPWPEPPARNQRVSFLPHVLLALIAVLILEWCSYHLGSTD